MRIVTKVVIIIGIFFLFATAVYGIYLYNTPLLTDQTSPVFELQMNENERTLIVNDINFNTNWDHISIEGKANRPSGPIDKGDQITNCYDEVKVYYSDILIGKWSFDRYNPDYEEIQFVGEWNSTEASHYYTFLPNQKYKKYKPTKEDDEVKIGNNNSLVIMDGKFELVTQTSPPQVKLFSAGTNSVKESFNYDFSNRYNYLHLWNNNSSLNYIRNIPKVRNGSDIEKYEGQKVNITGAFSSINLSLGYLTSNETNLEVLVLLGNYTEGKATLYDGKKLDVIGFIFKPDKNSTWTKPYIKFIESINIIK